MTTTASTLYNDPHVEVDVDADVDVEVDRIPHPASEPVFHYSIIPYHTGICQDGEWREGVRVPGARTYF